MSKYIALDVGEKRVGVAASDDLGLMAMPMTTYDRETSIVRIADLVMAEKPEAIVIGLPYLPSGGLGSQAVDVKIFTAELADAISTPLIYENEVLTSVEAKNRLKMIKKGRIEKGETDSMAACIILESFMNRSKN